MLILSVYFIIFLYDNVLGNFNEFMDKLNSITGYESSWKMSQRHYYICLLFWNVVRWCSWCGDTHICVSESLSEALKAITVSTELVEEELKPHLDVLLTLLLEKSEFTPMCSLTIPQSIYTFLCICQPINLKIHLFIHTYVYLLQHPILVPWSIREPVNSHDHMWKWRMLLPDALLSEGII